MAHIAVHLNADIILVVSAVRYNNNRCIILTFNLKDIGLLTHCSASFLFGDRGGNCRRANPMAGKVALGQTYFAYRPRRGGGGSLVLG